MGSVVMDPEEALVANKGSQLAISLTFFFVFGFGCCFCFFGPILYCQRRRMMQTTLPEVLASCPHCSALNSDFKRQLEDLPAEVWQTLDPSLKKQIEDLNRPLKGPQ